MTPPALPRIQLQAWADPRLSLSAHKLSATAPVRWHETRNRMSGS
jgi:hypothetical protein